VVLDLLRINLLPFARLGAPLRVGQGQPHHAGCRPSPRRLAPHKHCRPQQSCGPRNPAAPPWRIKIVPPGGAGSTTRPARRAAPTIRTPAATAPGAATSTASCRRPLRTRTSLRMSATASLPSTGCAGPTYFVHRHLCTRLSGAGGSIPSGRWVPEARWMLCGLAGAAGMRFAAEPSPVALSQRTKDAPRAPVDL
jgi:hypothetical protein